MRNYPTIGLQAPDLLLPKSDINLTCWSVVACDQFTAQPEYWQRVEEKTEGVPSTYHLMLPEAYLGSAKADEHQARVNQTMSKYLEGGVFRAVEGFTYIERETSTGVRQGLIAALDLDCYDFSPESTSLIRATEGTIVDRLPPRIAIRKDAPLELPHILVLIDDPDFSVIQPIGKNKKELDKLYEFNLMEGGGAICGYHVNQPSIEEQLVLALQKLKSAERQTKRYGISEHPLLYAVGDGNHSLATAKSIWEMMKSDVPSNHPARYALVEIVNLHDPSIVFEPIHRVVMHIEFNLELEIKTFFNEEIEISTQDNPAKLRSIVEDQQSEYQVFGFIFEGNAKTIKITNPPHTLAVGSLQRFLDSMKDKYPSMEIDYIHGDQAITELSAMPGNAGFVLPAMGKYKLFEAVLKNGPLPRKTFSMGEAKDKRYYLECRKINEN